MIEMIELMRRRRLQLTCIRDVTRQRPLMCTRLFRRLGSRLTGASTFNTKLDVCMLSMWRSHGYWSLYFSALTFLNPPWMQSCVPRHQTANDSVEHGCLSLALSASTSVAYAGTLQLFHTTSSASFSPWILRAVNDPAEVHCCNVGWQFHFVFILPVGLAANSAEVGFWVECILYFKRSVSSFIRITVTAFCVSFLKSLRLKWRSD